MGVSRSVRARCAAVFSGIRAWRYGRLFAAFAAAGATGCATPRARSSTAAPVQQASAPAPIEPSPLLELVRSEREISQFTYAPVIKTGRGDDRGAGDSERELTEVDSSEEEVRHVLVRTTRLATWESLARYALRYAENRRPRRLHDARFLVRTRGVSLIRGGTGADKTAVRRLLRDSRTELKRCLVAAEARRPEIIIKAPSGLVVEQALSRGAVVYEFDVHFDEDGTSTVTGDDARLDAKARVCIADVMTAGVPTTTGVMDLPLVAFVQPPKIHRPEGMNLALANQAAGLGWQHYERKEFHEALAFFDDAYWVFHRAEYKVLIGMALEALDRRNEAADAYADYVARRSDAPDALELRLKIALLRRA